MIVLPSSAMLQPQAADGIYCFRSESTELVKIDLLFEAGSAYQAQKLCAAAAIKLLPVATRSMNATRMAEFLDYRGVIVETNNEVQQSTLTVYMLRRFANEVIPVIGQMLAEPAYDERDFNVWQEKKRQEIAAYEMRTPERARRLFYESLFGPAHPLGRHASPEDAAQLTLEPVQHHYRQYYQSAGCTVVVAGKVDDELLALVQRNILANMPMANAASLAPLPSPHSPCAGHFSVQIPNARQTTLRIGRVLPLQWNELDYARFTILTTLLGGYFGSRLMANLREDKGYTYGVTARTQIYRGVIVFFITTDVATHVANAAEKEIILELERLQQIDEEEMELVKTVLTADFVRSVDGVFERSSRFCDMYATCVTEQFTENLRTAINETTAGQLQELARRLLAPGELDFCRAGA